MKNRLLKDYLIRKSNTPLGRIIVLTGARQTGKTTLAMKCFPGYKYLSIEDPVLRMQYKKLTAAQWANLYPSAILDEVQKEPILIESIKSVYDQYPKAHYVLLVSIQLLLLNKIRERIKGSEKKELLLLAEKSSQKVYILMEARLEALFKSEEEYKILEKSVSCLCSHGSLSALVCPSFYPCSTALLLCL